MSRLLKGNEERKAIQMFGAEGAFPVCLLAALAHCSLSVLTLKSSLPQVFAIYSLCTGRQAGSP